MTGIAQSGDGLRDYGTTGLRDYGAKGPWGMDDGQWTMGNGPWGMDDGQ